MKMQWAMIAAWIVVSVMVLPGCSKSGDEADGKDKPLVVGFSQIGAESEWRKANTESIKATAKERGITLKFSDAQGKQENQIKAIHSFIVQEVDVIAFSPVKETGWEAVLKEAKRAGIPVILSDRTVDVSDDTLYASSIGADCVEEGRQAAKWLAKYTKGKANIVELTGTPGSAPANDRKSGFAEVLKKYPNMKIIKSQTGNFERAKGKQVMESFLRSAERDQITALYAHNDDMALGAIRAIEAAGMKPGKDIIIVSIDGVRDALEAIQAGKLNCSVECNPMIGPALFDMIQSAYERKKLPQRVYVKDDLFDATNVEEALPTRQY